MKPPIMNCRLDGWTYAIRSSKLADPRGSLQFLRRVAIAGQALGRIFAGAKTRDGHDPPMLRAARTTLATAAALALACLAIAIDPAEAVACAPAPPRGEEVRIAEEEAIILWDPATRTEHFIRRAQFRSTARAFGFLVPTPATPALGEV